MKKMERLFLIMTVFAISAFSLMAENFNPIPNPGFEEGIQGWKISDNVTKHSPEAARTGKNGLRVRINSPEPRGSSAFTVRFPVDAGQDITLSFWAKADKKMLAVYLYFYDKNRRIVKQSGKRPQTEVNKTGGQWHEYKLTVNVPQNAVAVAAWIHAFSNTTGTVDLDDFAFSGLPANAKPIGKKKMVNRLLPERIHIIATRPKIPSP